MAYFLHELMQEDHQHESLQYVRLGLTVVQRSYRSLCIYEVVLGELISYVP